MRALSLAPTGGHAGTGETSELSLTASDLSPMYALLVGPNRDLEAALRSQGVETRRLDGHVTADDLDGAGVADADLLVVTDVAEATAIPVAREANPAVRVVVYSPETMPEFVRGQVDLALAPGVLAADAVAEELAGTAS